jgi:hypothetical protein
VKRIPKRAAQACTALDPSIFCLQTIRQDAKQQEAVWHRFGGSQDVLHGRENATFPQPGFDWSGDDAAAVSILDDLSSWRQSWFLGAQWREEVWRTKPPGMMQHGFYKCRD